MTMTGTKINREAVVDFEPHVDLLTFSKAVADDVRLRILRILRNESFGVLELCQILNLKQSALSHHLKILSDSQLLSRRREGNSIFYSRNVNLLGSLARLQAEFYASVDTYVLDAEIVARVKTLQENRETKSQDFFRQHHEQFAENQELVAPISAYEQQLLELLNSRFNESNVESVLEVGPGTGEFIPRLRELFSEVDVLDNSPEMLAAAKTYCRERAITGVNYVLGDTQSEQLADEQYQCVVMNMVLHHNASPSRILTDVFTKMQHNGRLFISELGTHQQDWVRESCGDLWLGFNSDELNQMAVDAGFKEGASCYYAQRNGFVVLLKEFIKS
ncbi:MAG: metalloregulator ArsR/SmtB family transcription factor [Enterobacterales bacterium]|nr:metalloregulator ArsR/SmtB family transcription factor [Enterobacterales bacterium]